MVLLSTSLIIAGIYLFWMAKVLQGWHRYVSIANQAVVDFASISIVVPFKDESENLPELLRSFEKLDYDRSKFEVVFINDASTDSGAELVSAWIEQCDIAAVVVNSKKPGKKAAQEVGVRTVQYDIVACTDADCMVPEGWLKHINMALTSKDSSLAFGPVCLAGVGQGLQKTEFNALIASTLGMLSQGWSVMGNGANMAFKKKAYMQVADRLAQINTPSGDDVFLLQELGKMGKKPGIIAGKTAMVRTKPQPTLTAFLNQRIRWASKARYFTHAATLFVGSLVFVTNTVLLAALLLAPFTPAARIAFILLFAVKSLADYLLLKSHASYFGLPFTFWHVVVQEFINIIYVPLVALLSQTKSYTWKGRDY
jgi:biofilm PGA synthesis N-glycosyltransferase PgaC